MGFWGALIGGVVGGLVAGPVGGAFGAGLGAALDEGNSNDTGLPELPMELEWMDDADGRLLRITPGCEPAQVGYRVDFVCRSTGKLLQGRAPYRDDDGDFFAAAPSHTGERDTVCYIGFGFADNHRQDVLTRVIVLDEAGARGAAHFSIDWPGGAGSQARLLRPLIALAMRVARADGSLEREEVARIREVLVDAFSLDSTERETLREMMKATTPATTAELAHQLPLRFPNMEIIDVLTFLSEIAHADGRMHETEAALIKEIATAYGATAEEWRELEEALALRPDGQQTAELLALFNLSPGASLTELKSAYRSMMRDYHPDKVAHLPAEFQEVAVRKSQQLNAAYESLSRAL